MATHAYSTTAPAVQPRLLPFTFRPVPPVDDPRTATSCSRRFGAQSRRRRFGTWRLRRASPSSRAAPGT